MTRLHLRGQSIGHDIPNAFLGRSTRGRSTHRKPYPPKKRKRPSRKILIYQDCCWYVHCYYLSWVLVNFLLLLLECHHLPAALGNGAQKGITKCQGLTSKNFEPNTMKEGQHKFTSTGVMSEKNLSYHVGETQSLTNFVLVFESCWAPSTWCILWNI